MTAKHLNYLFSFLLEEEYSSPILLVGRFLIGISVGNGWSPYIF